MSEVKTNLPQVRVDEPNLQRLLDNLALVLKTWNGETGNDLDTVITYRDLIEDTSIATRFNQAQAAGSSGGIDTTTSGDLTIPPQLNTLVVGQGATKNVLSWAGTGTGSYSYTEIWRHTSDDLGNATLNGTTEAEVYADDVGDIAQQYYYWVRGISTGGSPGPFNATAGTAQTISAVDTAYIADAAIVEAKIANLAVTNAKIALLAVDTAQIAAAAITNAKIGTAAIETANIKDANVDTLQVANEILFVPAISNVGSVTHGNMSSGTQYGLSSLSVVVPVLPAGITTVPCRIRVTIPEFSLTAAAAATGFFRTYQDAVLIANGGDSNPFAAGTSAVWYKTFVQEFTVSLSSNTTQVFYAKFHCASGTSVSGSFKALSISADFVKR